MKITVLQALFIIVFICGCATQHIQTRANADENLFQLPQIGFQIVKPTEWHFLSEDHNQFANPKYGSELAAIAKYRDYRKRRYDLANPCAQVRISSINSPAHKSPVEVFKKWFGSNVAITIREPVREITFGGRKVAHAAISFGVAEFRRSRNEVVEHRVNDRMWLLPLYHRNCMLTVLMVGPAVGKEASESEFESMIRSIRFEPCSDPRRFEREVSLLMPPAKPRLKPTRSD